MKDILKISLKKADFSDIEFLWYLRNQSEVYRYSKNSRPVLWEKHINWVFPIILGIDTKRELFIIKNSITSVGQIRLDYNNQNEARVSISILKEFQKKGFATQSLNLVIKKIKKQKITKKLIAEIHKENLPSLKFFEKFNFKFKKKTGNWLRYILILR